MKTPALILVSMAVAYSCGSPEELPKERDFSNWPFSIETKTLSPGESELLDAWEDFPLPSLPEFEDLDEGWDFAIGKKNESLTTALDQLPTAWEQVSLPHSEDLPNRALWYRRILGEVEHGLLQIDADDGAKVYLDGEEISPEEGESVVIPAGASGKELVVRVLNNAMSGGLRAVKLFPKLAFARFLEEGQVFAELTLLTKRALGATGRDHSALLELLRSKNGPGISGWPEDMLPFLAGPLIQQVGPDSLLLLLETLPDAPDCKLVVMDYKGNVVATFAGEPKEGLLEFGFNDWPAGAEVSYYIEAGDFRTPEYSLSLPDPSTVPVTFTAWADSQGGWQVFSALCQKMALHKPDFSIGVGDLTPAGWKHSEWSMLLASLEPLSSIAPVYLLPGNHDYDGYARDLIPQNFLHFSRGGRYRAWSRGPARFVALDPNASFPIGIDHEQAAWLNKELDSPEWKGAAWRFVLIHQPPYSQGWPGYSGDAFIRDWVEANAEPAGIDFVISGHTHDYERLSRAYSGQETTFLILGGGGGNLEPDEMDGQVKMDLVVKKHHFALLKVSETEVEVNVYDLDGALIDRYDRNK